MNSKDAKNHSTYEELKIPGGCSNLKNKAEKDLKQKEKKTKKNLQNQLRHIHDFGHCFNEPEFHLTVF